MQVVKSNPSVGTILVRISASERAMIESFSGHRMTGERAFATSCCYQQPGSGYYLVMGKDEDLSNAQRTVNLLTYAIHCKGVSKSTQNKVDMQQSVRMNKQGEIISRSIRTVEHSKSVLQQPAKRFQIVLVKGYTGTWRHPEPKLVRRSEQASKGRTMAIADALAAFDKPKTPAQQPAAPAKLEALVSRFAKC